MKFIFSIVLFAIGLQINCQTSLNVTDNKGLKQGYWIKTDPVSGKIAYKGTFKDNKPTGVFRYYYKEVDTVHTIMDFRNDGKIGYAQIFYMTGTLQAKGKYLNEKKDSLWNFYDESGKIISTESYKDGKKDGKSQVFYQNGIVSEERNFKNDLNHGEFKQFYDDKKLKAEGNYVEGKLIGKNAYYYPSGIPAAMGFYNPQGNKHGVWIYKDKEGKVTKKEVYNNGKILSDKEAEEWLKKNKDKQPKETAPKSDKPKTTKPKTTTSKGTSTKK